MRRTNRELVMLAHTFEQGKDRTAGMFLSEKLDGMRALWLPHTRGVPVARLPFANREKDKREHVATGLWSRYGKVIHCPEFFTDGFPQYPLDGELWLGRGKFQEMRSVCSKLEPIGDDWYPVEFKAFDAPTYAQVFTEGRINNPHWSKTIKPADCMDAIGKPEDRLPQPFEFTYNWLDKQNLSKNADHLALHKQRHLPFNTRLAEICIAEELRDVLGRKGEGLILRHPASMWEPIRTRMLLKVVPEHDAEAIIVGFNAGEFGKDGKLWGLLGSAVVRWNGVVFNLSGFTDAERALQPAAAEWARNNPGQLIPGSVGGSAVFSIGEEITFTYKELTDDGIPKSGRFKRKA